MTSSEWMNSGIETLVFKKLGSRLAWNTLALATASLKNQELVDPIWGRSGRVCDGTKGILRSFLPADEMAPAPVLLGFLLLPRTQIIFGPRSFVGTRLGRATVLLVMREGESSCQ